MRAGDRGVRAVGDGVECMMLVGLQFKLIKSPGDDGGDGCTTV